jgi:hypothetical protein
MKRIFAERTPLSLTDEVSTAFFQQIVLFFSVPCATSSASFKRIVLIATDCGANDS